MDSTEQLVACKHCGVVFVKRRAGDFEVCPVCKAETNEAVQMPKLGIVYKWWREVD